MALRSMLGLTQPHLLELPDQRMATVRPEQDPMDVADDAIKALYASVEKVRKQTPFQLEPLRARWAVGAPLVVRAAMWGLPVPAGVDDVPSVDERFPVHVDAWQYGLVAEILHEGSHAEQDRAVDRLRRYIEDEGLELLGPHEEEYLTPPGAAVPKTLVRYRVRRR